MSVVVFSAAAQVSGLVALLRELSPRLGAADLRAAAGEQPQHRELQHA